MTKFSLISTPNPDEPHPGVGTRTRKYTKSVQKSSEGLRISPDVFGDDQGSSSEMR